MIIYKCFTCNYETNATKFLKKKEIGEVYSCPECKISHGCLVETETQKEFPEDYVLSVKRNPSIPVYYGERLDNENINLQVFEFIHIPSGTFKYGYCNVPGMYYELTQSKQHLNAKECAVLKTVGKNLMIDSKNRNPKSQIDLTKKQTLDDLIIPQEEEKISQDTKEIIEKLREENRTLIDSVYNIDLYKVLLFDLEYLIKSPLNFKAKYKLPKDQTKRIIKKYNVTQIVQYQDNTWLNNLWHKYDTFYLGIPPLDKIDLWLDKAWKSKAVCCGVVPFSPLSEWYDKYIDKKAQIRLLKKQKGIPFPIIEFNYRYNKTEQKVGSLMTKEDKKLGQGLFNFASQK